MGATVRFRPERGTWEVYFFDQGKRWQRRIGKGDQAKLEAERIAEAFNRSIEERRARNDLLYPGAPAPFEHLARAWWDAVRPSRPNSSRVMLQAVVERRLIPYFGELEARRIDADRIRAFVVHEIEERGHARETVESSCSWLRRILNWGVEQGVLKENPVPDLMRIAREAAAARARPRRQAPAWSKDEVRRIIALCSTRGAWLADPVLFASQQGCRRGEILALEWTELDLRSGRATILQSSSWGQVKATKADRVRVIELTHGSVEMLERRAWERFRGQPFEHLQKPGRVFLDRRERPWDHHSFEGYWKRARALAHARDGVRPFKFHAFRHTWATWALAGGEDPAWCAEQLGDRLEIFLRRYAHALPGKKRSMAFADLSVRHDPAPRSESGGRDD